MSAGATAVPTPGKGEAHLKFLGKAARMNPDVLIAYLVTVGVFFASPPGPSQILMIASSLRVGVRRSVWTVAGDLSANCIQMTVAAFGLAALLASSAAALTVVKWAGVAYLVWIAWTKIRAPAPGLDAGGSNGIDGAIPAQDRPAALFRQAFLTSAANPKAVFFFAALFPQFIDPASAILPQLAVLGAIYLAIDGALLFLWGAIAARGLGWLRGRGRLLNRVSGGLMLVAAALLALRDGPRTAA